MSIPQLDVRRSPTLRFQYNSWNLQLLNVQHHESFSRLVLYQVKNVCCIKLRTCVVSSQEILLYQVLSMSSCVEVGFLYCDLLLYQDCILVLYQDFILVVSIMYLCCIKSNDSHRRYPMRWVSLNGDGLVLYQFWRLVLYQVMMICNVMYF